MATEELEFDSKDDIMEEIERITAPPQSDDVKIKKKPMERGYYRKPGKPHNHDYCDSCGEGGDLLCCDRCPCSFHLECNDPPIDEDEFPIGEWLCHKCKTRPIKQEPPDNNDDAVSTCSSRASDAQGAGGSISIGPRGSKPPSRRPSPVPMSTDAELMLEFDPEELARKPLSVLAKVASRLNPKQFQLPQDLICPYQFPGTSRQPEWRPVNGSRYRQVENSTKPTVIEMDNNMVPLPAKLCFICERSCRRGPLIQCDYCPCLFHLDCLDPPLTAVPQSLWMCPNHAQHHVDSKMVKTLKVTDRIQLWNEFSAPIDGHTIKVNFLKKVHRKDPPFLYKVNRKRKKLMKVPLAIKYRYQNPQAPFPAPHKYTPPEGQYLAEPKDQQEWLSAIMQFHTELAKEVSSIEQTLGKKDEKFSTKERASSPPRLTPKPTASIAPVQKQNEAFADCDMDVGEGGSVGEEGVSNNDERSSKDSSPVLENSEAASLVAASKDTPNGTVTSDKLGNKEVVVEESHEDRNSRESLKLNGVLDSEGSSGGSTAGSDVAEEERGRGSCVCSVKSSASQEMIDISREERMEVDTEAGRSTRAAEPQGDEEKAGAEGDVKEEPVDNSTVQIKSEPGCNDTLSVDSSTVQNLFQSADEIDMDTLDPHILKFLALQQLKTILKNGPTIKEEVARVTSTSDQSACSAQVAMTTVAMSTANSNEVSFSSSYTTPEGCQLRARATLCPVKGNGMPVAMTYRNLSIGTASDCGVCLASYGHCNFISSQHACIFYDQISGEFELLNYSCHGTMVDGMLYSCEVSERSTPQVATPNSSTLVNTVRKINKKGRAKKAKHCEKFHDTDKVKLEPSDFMTSSPFQKSSCDCVSSLAHSSKVSGWEGSALLHHGSVIQMGCLQFVFSVVDPTPANPPPLKPSTTRIDSPCVNSRKNLSTISSQPKTPS